MIIDSLDWNEIWKEWRSRRTVAQKSASSWGEHSSKTRRTGDDTYARRFLRIMEPEPDWTVLDMGCGTGTLALPLARLVQHVTAADFSQGMLDEVEQRCSREGMGNVATKKLAWEDDWQEAGVAYCDVAVASRSLVTEDLRGAISKLQAVAREKVFISTIVRDGPFDRRIFDALGRPLNPGPDYICNYNLLYQMGILARVDFIRQDQRTFESREEAVSSMSWTLDRMTPAEEETLQRFIDRHLVKQGDHWATDYEFTPVWAVLWWETNSARSTGVAGQPRPF